MEHLTPEAQMLIVKRMLAEDALPTCTGSGYDLTQITLAFSAVIALLLYCLLFRRT